jgi:hypothetical protein
MCRKRHVGWRRIWSNTTKMNHEKIGDMDWTGLGLYHMMGIVKFPGFVITVDYWRLQGFNDAVSNAKRRSKTANKHPNINRAGFKPATSEQTTLTLWGCSDSNREARATESSHWRWTNLLHEIKLIMERLEWPSSALIILVWRIRLADLYPKQ